MWDPVGGDYGALPFGTNVTSLVSLIISAPIGDASTIFLHRLSDALTFLPGGSAEDLPIGLEKPS